MTTLYIAGPMSGLPEFNYPAFEDAERTLDPHFDVLSPHRIDFDQGTTPGEHPWVWYMRHALRLLLDADGVALLPGWQDSRGAKIEHDLAVELGMPVRYVDHWVDHIQLERLRAEQAGRAS